DIDPRWLDRAEDVVAGGQGIGPARGNLLAWVRGCALMRERRYAEAARAFSTIDDTGDPSGIALLRLVPPMCHATAAYWDRDLERATRSLEHAMRVSLHAGAGVMFFPSVLNLV